MKNLAIWLSKTATHGDQCDARINSCVCGLEARRAIAVQEFGLLLAELKLQREHNAAMVASLNDINLRCMVRYSASLAVQPLQQQLQAPAPTPTPTPAPAPRAHPVPLEVDAPQPRAETAAQPAPAPAAAPASANGAPAKPTAHRRRKP